MKGFGIGICSNVKMATGGGGQGQGHPSSSRVRYGSIAEDNDDLLHEVSSILIL